MAFLSKTKSHFESIKSKYPESSNLSFEFIDNDDTKNPNTKPELIAKQNNNNLFRSKYEHIGTFNNKSSFWYWAWASPFKSSASFQHFENTKQYVLNKHSNWDNKEADYYRFLINYPSFFVTNDDLTKLLLLVLYTNKQCWYVHIQDHHRTHLYLLTEIIQF
jgi:hypothetical protein